MLVIGVDPGTATTGFGLVREHRGGVLEAVDYGVITTPADEDMASRLLMIYRSLLEILNRYQPDSSAVEKLFFQKNVKTALSVGQGRGAALIALASARVPVGEYTPNEIKQAVVGYGNADKRQVQQMVKVLLQMTELPAPDDAADALAVAICHIHSRGYAKRMGEQHG